MSPPKRATIILLVLFLGMGLVSAKGPNHKDKGKKKKVEKIISALSTDEKREKNKSKGKQENENDIENDIENENENENEKGSDSGSLSILIASNTKLKQLPKLTEGVKALKTNNMHTKLCNMLLRLHGETYPETVVQKIPGSEFYNWTDILRVTHDGYVVVDIVAESDGDVIEHLIQHSLIPLGYKPSATHGRLASGMLPVSAIMNLEDIPYLVRVSPSLATRNSGSVTSEGVRALRADIVQQKFGLKGKGAIVGVLSDSFNAQKDAVNDFISGDLPNPKDVTILKDDLSSFNIDEGRAMMQLIHDVAPKAKLAFHTGFFGIADFAEGIVRLAKEAGCNVIVDDILYLAEPWFQDGPIAQAVDKVRSKGVAYFSAAGNQGRQSYEAPFLDSGVLGLFGRPLHNFDPSRTTPPVAPDPFQQVYLNNVPFAIIVLQWDEPFFSTSGAPGSANDLDLFIFSDDLRFLFGFGIDSNRGGDPIETIVLPVRAILESLDDPFAEGLLVNFIIEQFLGPSPGLMKITVFDGRGSGAFIDYPTNSGTVLGHANAMGGSAVGASFHGATKEFGVNPPEYEFYSSAGGVPILFDTAGNRLKDSKIRHQPRMLGPDGTSTTFFGGNFNDPNFPNPLFFGTSAAAAHVAGVAALLIDGNPKITAKEIIDVLEKTASDMDDRNTPGFDVGFDYATGWGFVDAKAAVKFIGVSPVSAEMEDTGEADRALEEKGLRGGKSG